MKSYIVVVTLLLAVIALGAPVSHVAAERQQTAEYAADDLGEFVAFCPFSHRAPDDPIVHRYHFGASHLHDFLGNVSTSATATVQTLLTSGTTCDPVTDRSAYWAPTLYDAKGALVAFDRVTIYVGGKCPATYPVAVPLLQFKLRYASRGEAGMYLSSGAAYTIHGDFFNAWEPAALENRMKCLRQEVKCGPEGFPGAVDPTPAVYPPWVRLPIVVKP